MRDAGTGVCPRDGAEACPKKEGSRRAPAARAASDRRSRPHRPDWRRRSRLESGLAVVGSVGSEMKSVRIMKKWRLFKKGMRSPEL